MSQTGHFGALIASRICHDLISPLGAIGNGVELLSLTGEDPGPEVALIGESAANANARLRFFRLAFGVADESRGVARGEIVSTLAALTRFGRVRYDWEVDADVSRAETKMALLAILCLDTALAFGGTVTARRDGMRWSVRGQADRLQIDAALWDGLLAATPAENALPSSQVQFLLLPEEARRWRRKLSVAQDPQGLAIGF